MIYPPSCSSRAVVARARLLVKHILCRDRPGEALLDSSMLSCCRRAPPPAPPLGFTYAVGGTCTVRGLASGLRPSRSPPEGAAAPSGPPPSRRAVLSRHLAAYPSDRRAEPSASAGGGSMAVVVCVHRLCRPLPLTRFWKACRQRPLTSRSPCPEGARARARVAKLTLPLPVVK